MPVEIIGGGIGGLALAALLRRLGRRVRVHERASALPETGTALGMWPAAMTVLDRLGVGDRVREHGVAQRVGDLRRPDGTVLARVDTGRDVWLVTRPQLLGWLAAAAGAVEFDSTFAQDRPWVRGGGALVVGADGVHSVVRGALDDAPVIRPGATIWRGAADLPRTTASETWGPGALFGMTPQPSGRTNWFAMVRQPPEQQPQELPDLFGRWHGEVRDVIGATDPSTTLRHEAVLAPRLRRYAGGRVVLIGDAAHAMMPNLGRGACETLLDADTLAALLTEYPVEEALARYDAARRCVSRRVVLVSSAMARVATATRGRRPRDLLLRVAGGRRSGPTTAA